MRWRFWLHPFFANNLFEWFSKFSFSNKIENQAERSLKSLCDKSLKKKKCDWTKFFVCPSRWSWYLTFFLTTLFKVHKFAYITEWFSGFSKFSFSNKIKINPRDCSKVCVTKFWKRKMWLDQILRLSEPIVVVFDFFPDNTIQGP